MMNYNERVLKKLKEFRKECPEGFEKLREHIGTLKPGNKFSADDYLKMFDALAETLNLTAAWRLVQERGLQCTKNPLEKVLMDISRYITKYDWEHPHEVEIVLPEEMEAKVRECVDAMLREYGYKLNDGRRKFYLISKINGERFESNRICLNEQKKG